MVISVATGLKKNWSSPTIAPSRRKLGLPVVVPRWPDSRGDQIDDPVGTDDGGHEKSPQLSFLGRVIRPEGPPGRQEQQLQVHDPLHKFVEIDARQQLATIAARF